MTKLKALIGKLNGTCQRAAERAIEYCMARGNHELEPEHLLLALLDDANSDFSLLAMHFKIPASALERELLDEIGAFRTGSGRMPVFSMHLSTLFEHAWLLASLEGGAAAIRSADLLLALLSEQELSQLAGRGLKLFLRHPVTELKHALAELGADYPEARDTAPAMQEIGERPVGMPAGEDAHGGRETALGRFTISLTDCARRKLIDPVLGRDMEIRLLIDILMRSRQNNPILTGEAGVGKTAVVEGLAQRIADGQVPAQLVEVELHLLDLGLLQAGAGVKGEFEARLRSVIEEVKRSPRPVILFIDEAHAFFEAGGRSGRNDAANLLKPALARGELRTIAATTWSEYKKFFERDAALARRFQVVKVEEPAEAVACLMLRGLAGKMERHFQVRVMDDAIVDAVRLSARYLSGRQLPDKAFGVLDTACAKVALGLGATPAAIEEARAADEALALEISALEREARVGRAHAERLRELMQARDAHHAALDRLEARWQQEKSLVGKIQVLREQLEGGWHRDAAWAESEPAEEKRRLLDSLQQALDALQGEHPLVPVCVDAHAVAQVIASWTGIPVGRMLKDELRTMLGLTSLLEQRVVGQSAAIARIAQRVRTARAKVEDPDRPKAVFLLTGPPGVGKTETALALADLLYGGERNLITINMSEFQEAHTVSSLKDSPPGCTAYGGGGVLTEAVRRKPYSVVLLDEAEKAHADVLEMFYKVFDKGKMDDAQGREIDFRNTIIILTSNLGAEAIMQACRDRGVAAPPDTEELEDLIRPQLHKTFKPALLARMTIIPYHPLPDAALAEIIALKLERIRARVARNHRAALDYSAQVIEAVLARCTEVDSGARNVDHILNGTLLPEIAETMLSRMAEGMPVRRVRIDAARDSGFSYRID